MPRVERMEIDLALAIEMTNAAKAKAIEINAPMSIAVLDAGANLLSFQRMDGAELIPVTCEVALLQMVTCLA